jgi:hypothetical protein
MSSVRDPGTAAGHPHAGNGRVVFRFEGQNAIDVDDLETHLSSILNGRFGISAEMAIRLSKAFMILVS